MKKSMLFLIATCGVCFLSSCAAGTTTPPSSSTVPATQFSIAPATSAPTSGTAFVVTVTALGASGQTATSYSGTIHFTSSDPHAQLPADSAMTGVTATFSVTLNTAGPQTVTVTGTGSIQGISNAINVNATIAANRLWVVSASYLVTIGKPIMITVTVVDASGDTVANYSGTVHFTSSDSKAVLPANSTLVNGVGTFSATLNTSGSETITGTDTSNASITGNTGPLPVSGPATHFQFSSITRATTRSFTLVGVAPQDASNNFSNSYRGTMHITSSDSKAILPADLTLPTQFGDLANLEVTFEIPGNQTITATDTMNPTITGTSSSISVTATTLPAITSGPPPNGTVGSKYGPTNTTYLLCRTPPQLNYRVCTPCAPNTLAGCGGSYPNCRYDRNTRDACISIDVFIGFELKSTGGLPPYKWTGVSLPPGLSMVGSLIEGTPTPGAAATYNAMVTLNDSGTPPAAMTLTYPIVIRNPAQPVVSMTPPLPAGAINHPFTFTFGATAGLPPYQNWMETGPLPTGLALTSAGVLSGTPTVAGTFPITVTVEDSLGQISPAQNFNFQVYAHGFKATGSLGTERDAATATLLNTGKVLVAGGTDASGNPLATAEIYDPTTGLYSPTGSMGTARDNFAAALLPSGKVLVTGGLDNAGNPLASAEVYDPAVGTFSPTGSAMTIARASHTETLLNTGKVLITGWDNAFAELFDPSTGIFTATGSMVDARVSHTATLLKNGEVLITGGIGAARQALAEAEVYDPVSGSFSRTLGSLATGRDWHTATLLPDGTVLLTGGLDNTGAAINSAEVFSLSSESFSTAKGNMETPRAFHTATLLKDGTALIAGGMDSTLTLSSAEIYDPTAGTFSPTGSMVTTRQSHTANLLNDGTVLVTGGTDGAVLGTAELYQ